MKRRLLFPVFVFLVCFSGLAANARAGFLYVVDQVNGGPNQIFGFNVNESTGALTLLGGFPVAAGTGGAGSFSEMLTIDRFNRRLYVINEGASTVSAFSINPGTGALTALPFSPITVGGDCGTIAVHPSGSPLTVGCNSGMASFSITPTTATAAAGSPYSTSGASPFSSGFSKNGNFVYTGGNVGSIIAGFSVNTATGVLTPLAGSPFDSSAGNPVAYATDSVGRLFVSNFGTGVRAFTTSGGVPTGVAGNPFPSGLAGGVQGALSPNGNFYYVADRSANKVGGYQIAGSGAATTLTAVAGSPFTSGGSFTDALVLNVSGSFLFAANGISRNLTTYSVNTGTGVLTFGNVQAVNTVGGAGLLTGIDYYGTASGVTFSATEGQSFTGTVATFTSPNNSFAATIDWGDGNTTAGVVSGGGGNFTVSGTHTYAEDGTFSVLVTIHDNTDNSDTPVNSTAIVTENNFILAAGAAINVPEGTPVINFAVATFQDPGSPDPASAFTATIDWGDGTTTAGTVSGGGGNFTVTGSHTYTDEGSFGFYLVTVSEPSANFTIGPVGSSVTVTEADVLAAGAPVTISPSACAPFSGTVANFTDAYAGNTAADFTATINWGDSNTTAGTVSGGGASYSVSGTHTYTSSGPFTLTVTLNDDAPGTATANATGTANVTADITPPTIICPGSITKFTDSGQSTATVNPGTPVASDNGCSVTVTGVRSDGKALNAPYPIGVTVITWTAKDAAGNTASCGQSIAVMAPSGQRRIKP